jgi:hypothetical protein
MPIHLSLTVLHIQVSGTNNQILFGTESNAGATVFTGGTANFGVFGSAGNFGVQFATNNIVRQTISAAGATTFTGTLAASNLSGTNTGDQTNVTGTAGNVTGIVAIANGGTGSATQNLLI